MNFDFLFDTASNAEIARSIRHVQGLRVLFGSGPHDAEDCLNAINAGRAPQLDQIDLASAMKYHEIARRAIEFRKDTYNTQATRIQIIEHAIARLLWS